MGFVTLPSEDLPSSFALAFLVWINHFLMGNFLILLLHSCLTVLQTSAKATSVCLQQCKHLSYQIPQKPLSFLPKGGILGEAWQRQHFLMVPVARFGRALGTQHLSGGPGLSQQHFWVRLGALGPGWSSPQWPTFLSQLSLSAAGAHGQLLLSQRGFCFVLF